MEDDVEGEENATEDSLGNSESLDHRLILKKNTKALVWKHFSFEADENGRPCSTGTPKCRLCYQTIAAKDSNTTNLHSHLKYKYPEEYLLVQRASEKGQKKKKAPHCNQPSLTTTWDKQKLLSTSSNEICSQLFSHRHATIVHSG